MWGQENQAGQANQNEINTYLNIELLVGQDENGEDIVVRMPLNCPVSTELKGMSANQRKLMELLIEKAKSAKSDEDLVIKVPVRASLYVRGSKEADTSGWSSSL